MDLISVLSTLVYVMCSNTVDYSKMYSQSLVLLIVLLDKRAVTSATSNYKYVMSFVSKKC